MHMLSLIVILFFSIPSLFGMEKNLHTPEWQKICQAVATLPNELYACQIAGEKGFLRSNEKQTAELLAADTVTTPLVRFWDISRYAFEHSAYCATKNLFMYNVTHELGETLMIYDFVQKKSYIIGEHQEPLEEPFFSPSGEKVYGILRKTSQDNRIVRHNTTKKSAAKLIIKVPGTIVQYVISHDESTLAYNRRAHIPIGDEVLFPVYIKKLTSSRVPERIINLPELPRFFCLNTDGSTLAVMEEDGHITLFDTANPTQRKAEFNSHLVDTIGWDAQKKYFYAESHQPESTVDKKNMDRTYTQVEPTKYTTFGYEPSLTTPLQLLPYEHHMKKWDLTAPTPIAAPKTNTVIPIIYDHVHTVLWLNPYYVQEEYNKFLSADQKYFIDFLFAVQASFKERHEKRVGTPGYTHHGPMPIDFDLISKKNPEWPAEKLNQTLASFNPYIKAWLIKKFNIVRKPAPSRLARVAARLHLK